MGRVGFLLELGPANPCLVDEVLLAVPGPDRGQQAGAGSFKFGKEVCFHLLILTVHKNTLNRC